MITFCVVCVCDCWHVRCSTETTTLKEMEDSTQMFSKYIILATQYPSVHLYTTFPVIVEGSWSVSQLTLVERRASPWTGHQWITGPTHRDQQPFKPRDTFESWDELWKNSIQKQGEHANSTQTIRTGSQTRNLLAIRLTTAPLRESIL